MPFTRAWDASCPRVWARWREGGADWRVQDLPPEDDEKALEMALDIMLNDEVLCSAQKCASDPASVRDARRFWAEYLARRCSLACYREDAAGARLVALNVCYVKSADDEDCETYEGEGWRQVLAALDHMDSAADASAGVPSGRVLYGLGLIVSRDQRGRCLGARVLDAREPMCRALGVGGTVTVFTGPASQKLAAKAGFSVVAERSFADFARAGLQYPNDPTRVVKTMVKRYNHVE